MTAEHYKRRIPPEERLLRKVYYKFPDIEVRPVTKVSRPVLRDLVSKVLSGFPQDERDVLVYRFKLGLPVSRELKQIGNPSKVSQIKDTAIRRLQSKENCEQFSGFYWRRDSEKSYVKAWIVYRPPKLEEPEKVKEAEDILGKLPAKYLSILSLRVNLKQKLMNYSVKSEPTIPDWKFV